MGKGIARGKKYTKRAKQWKKVAKEKLAKANGKAPRRKKKRRKRRVVEKTKIKIVKVPVPAPPARPPPPPASGCADNAGFKCHLKAGLCKSKKFGAKIRESCARTCGSCAP